MFLYIAGINHYDPTCRERLRHWLKELADSHHGERAAFVATENFSEYFSLMKNQRPEFRELIRQKWPGSPPSCLDAFAASLGYEFDAHEEFFPHVCHLWLDEGDPRKHALNPPAWERLNTYEQWASPLCPDPMAWPDDACSALATFADYAWRWPAARPGERDEGFLQRLLHKIGEDGGDWGMVIVGESHMADATGSMLNLLRNNQQRCDPKSLRP